MTTLSIKTFAALICRELELKKPRIEYVKELMTPTTLAAAFPDDYILKVKANTSGHDLYFAIAHELRHLWQWQKHPEMFADYKKPGELSITEYNMQPAELDANAFAQLIMVDLFRIKPLYNGLPEEVKEAISNRAREIITQTKETKKMKGTEKQIKWANDIITEFQMSIETMRSNAERNAELNMRCTDNMGREFEIADIEACQTAFGQFFAQASATEIIDKRNNFKFESLKRMCAMNYINRRK